MRTVPTEHAKIVYDGSRYASSYASRDWLRILASIRDSFVARRIASPLWILSGWAAAVSIAHRNCAAAAPWLGAAAPLQGVAGAMGYLGSALSLLLVFRTNTAYQRYWEGRQIWETLVSAARDAAEFAAMYLRRAEELPKTDRGRDADMSLMHRGDATAATTTFGRDARAPGTGASSARNG